MINAMLRAFVPNWEDTGDPAVRERCGMLSGAVGILLNLLLFAGKLTAGVLAGAISVTADAFNNLSDAGSSIVTLIGFKLAGQEPDADHPFGHGRMEYLTGLVVSLLILLVGFELGKSSVEKILHPEPTVFSVLTAAVLLCSVAVKLWMWWFNSSLSGRLGSEALAATAADSRSDALATSVVLAGLVVSHFLHVQLDGWLGVLVAVFILKAGWGAAKDTLDPLLGTPPDPEEVAAIERLILEHPPIRGIHDLVIHDYGPGRRMMSCHAEVPANADFLEVHDVIDQTERDLRDAFRLEAVIHMDPVVTDDPEVERLRALAAGFARELDDSLTIHDFRITAGPLYTNLIFDVVVPYSMKMTDDEVRRALAGRLSDCDGRFHAVICVDHSYV